MRVEPSCPATPSGRSIVERTGDYTRAIQQFSASAAQNVQMVLKTGAASTTERTLSEGVSDPQERLIGATRAVTGASNSL